jgi:Fe-S-cluster-containing dehydrogenase component
MKEKYYLIIDVARCENCNNCFLACKDEHCGNDWPGYSISQPLHGQRWMNIGRNERGAFPVIDVAYRPQPCMHCDDAPCIKAAEGGAVVKREDGIVLIDPEKAKGQRQLVAACPYGAIYWNEKADVPQKCTLCAHLLDDGWKAPRCVQACPTGALSFGRVSDGALTHRKKKEGLAALEKNGQRTRPRVLYKNLYRYTSVFIAGSLATRRNGLAECLSAIPVHLYRDGVRVAETASDAFGDFRFDRLPPDSGDYEIWIGDEEQPVQRMTRLGQSHGIGTVWLK